VPKIIMIAANKTVANIGLKAFLFKDQTLFLTILTVNPSIMSIW
jgi:hypothetical protein